MDSSIQPVACLTFDFEKVCPPHAIRSGGAR
jgi:hypothetical protein